MIAVLLNLTGIIGSDDALGHPKRGFRDEANRFPYLLLHQPVLVQPAYAVEPDSPVAGQPAIG